MGKGILSGMVWGTVIGGLFTAFVSLYVPLPPQLETAQTAQAETAAVAQTAQDASTAVAEGVVTAPAEAAATAQAEDATPSEIEQTATIAAPVGTSREVTTSETVVAPSAPTETATATTTSQDATTAAADQVAPVAAETAAPVVEPVVEPVIETATSPNLSTPREQASGINSGEEIAAVAPDTAEARAQVSEVADRANVETASEAAEAAPSITGVELPAATATSEDTPIVIAAADPKRLKLNSEAQAPTQAEPATQSTIEPDTETETVSADSPIIVPVPQISNPVPGVVTNRLPSVGSPSTSQQEATPPQEAAPVESDTAPEVETATQTPPQNAIEQFSAQADIPEGASLFSIVLIDAGADGISRDKILELDLPITIAINPDAAGAKAAMQAYRDAGIEIMAMPADLPVASDPADVEVALTTYFNILPEAVGVLDPLDGRIQSNRSLLQPVLGAIRDTGHGLLTYDRGLNTAQKAARREDIPAATIYRVLDGDLEQTPLIKRYLDRAAFAANQDGSVVVVGRSYEATVTALLEWGLARKDGDLAIVPVSAVMKAGAE